jgi:hypothetical protein
MDGWMGERPTATSWCLPITLPVPAASRYSTYSEQTAYKQAQGGLTDKKAPMG